MADVLSRIVGPVVGTGAAATLYTVASLKRVTIREIMVVNTTTTRQSFKMSIGVDAAGTRIASDVFVEPNAIFKIPGVLVLEAAETLRWNGPATLTVTANAVIEDV